MLFSEFVEGTGCKENDHNYEVYKNLEIMYMNSNMSKQEIYEYGKKLVDNSKSPEQVALEESIKAEIAQLKEELKQARAEAKRYMEFHKEDKESGVKETYWKSQAEWQQELVKKITRKIAGLKWVLA